jgi:hypothetical protein
MSPPARTNFEGSMMRVHQSLGWQRRRHKGALEALDIALEALDIAQRHFRCRG